MVVKVPEKLAVAAVFVLMIAVLVYFETHPAAAGYKPCNETITLPYAKEIIIPNGISARNVVYVDFDEFKELANGTVVYLWGYSHPDSTHLEFYTVHDGVFYRADLWVSCGRAEVHVVNSTTVLVEGWKR